MADVGAVSGTPASSSTLRTEQIHMEGPHWSAQLRVRNRTSRQLVRQPPYRHHAPRRWRVLNSMQSVGAAWTTCTMTMVHQGPRDRLYICGRPCPGCNRLSTLSRDGHVSGRVDAGCTQLVQKNKRHKRTSQTPQSPPPPPPPPPTWPAAAPPPSSALFSPTALAKTAAAAMPDQRYHHHWLQQRHRNSSLIRLAL
eukprot:366538-Chlamydomonas_euryale.AAC.12